MGNSHPQTLIHIDPKNGRPFLFLHNSPVYLVGLEGLTPHSGSSAGLFVLYGQEDDPPTNKKHFVGIDVANPIVVKETESVVQRLN